jgi:uncharacterized membrane protein
VTVSFAYPLPWWALCLLAAACVALAVLAYARTAAVLTTRRRLTLSVLRATTLAALIVCLLRPVAVVPPVQRGAGIIAVLVDTSLSMGLADVNGRSRLTEALSLTRDRLLPNLARGFTVELHAVGEHAVRATLESLRPDGAVSNLTDAVREVRDRYRGRPLAGIVLISDGGDTTPATEARRSDPSAVPVVTIGVGSPTVREDREVRSVTVGPSALDASLVDLSATLVSHGRAKTGTIRLRQNGRLLDMRDVALSGDGSPVQQTFTVAPDRTAPAVFRVEVSDTPGELTLENNHVEVLVPPPGRPRRILLVEGAPGYEHSFLKRAWAEDPSLEVDSVVRKGRNDQGQDTFYVQANPARTGALSGGFPVSREALFAYDGVVFANTELDALPQESLDTSADFVSVRGGGVLVLGSRSLASQGITGSAFELALPLALTNRRSPVLQTSAGDGADRLRVSVTPEGRRHPVMRLGASDEESSRRWASLPALAATAQVGAARAGASVLAVTQSPAGATVPLIAVQRFGRGRTMIFGGEASWRWKMMMPASDHTYDTFWRQSLRWLAGEAPEPVSVSVPTTGVPVPFALPVELNVRDAAYAPIAGADVQTTIRTPDGAVHEIPVTRDPGQPGRWTGTWRAVQPGVYRVGVEARRGESVLGSADQYVLVGGSTPEFTDPRLNEPVLRRIADDSHGRYVTAADAARVGDLLRAARPTSSAAEVRDLWHNGWSLALVIALLSAEWLMRRRWGLR